MYWRAELSDIRHRTDLDSFFLLLVRLDDTVQWE